MNGGNPDEKLIDHKDSKKARTVNFVVNGFKTRWTGGQLKRRVWQNWRFSASEDCFS